MSQRMQLKPSPKNAPLAPVSYQSGFGNQFQSEAVSGALPVGRNSPQRAPLGLYAEEYDAQAGRSLGNFPQAFSHLAAVEAAASVVLAERVAEYRG